MIGTSRFEVALVLAVVCVGFSKVHGAPRQGDSIRYYPEEQWVDHVTHFPPRGRFVLAGDPVDLGSGVLRVQETDLSTAAGGLDLRFVRTYQSGASFSSPLGENWDFNLNQKIVLEFEQHYIPAWNGPTSGARQGTQPRSKNVPGGPLNVPIVGAYYFDGALGVSKFLPGNGLRWQTPDGTTLKLRSIGGTPRSYSLDPPDAFEMRQPDGLVKTFARLGGPDDYQVGLIYRLTSIEDRIGRRIVLSYRRNRTDEYDLLDRAADPFGREWTFEYGNDDRLVAVVDFSGRRVAFERDNARNLVTVRSPAVTGDPQGNDYPAGIETHYTYGTAGTNLEHSLLTIVRPQEWQNGSGPGTPYLQNTYDASGTRVLRQVLGGIGGSNPEGVSAGGTWLFLRHDGVNGATRDWGWFQEARRVLRIDPEGQAELTLFDVDGIDRLIYRFAGKLDPEAISETTDPDTLVDVDPANPDPQTDRLRSPLPGLVPQSVGTAIWRKEVDELGRTIERSGPGFHEKLSYYDGPDVGQRYDVVLVERLPAPADGSAPAAGTESLFEATLFEPFYNRVRATVDPRGFASWQPFEGQASPARYLEEKIFDYQEGDTSTGKTASIASHWDIDTDQSSVFALFASKGLVLAPIAAADELGDLNADGRQQEFGNVIQTRRPTASVFDDPADPNSGFSAQLRRTTFAYNDSGLRTSIVNATGDVQRFEYFSAADPTGTGANPLASPDGGGFQARVVQPDGTVETYGYDALGRNTTRTNGRGFTWSAVFNAVDQIVQQTHPGGSSFWYAYDWDGNQVQVRQQRWRPSIDANGVPDGSVVPLPDLVSDFSYDILGNLVDSLVPSTDQSRDRTRFRYDRLGRRILTLRWGFDADPSDVVAAVYDEWGRGVEAARGGLGSTFRSWYGAAPIPELAQIQDAPELALRSSSYDRAGNVVQRTDALGNATTFEFDGFQRLTRRTDALGGSRTWSYDPDGAIRVESAFDASGVLLAETRHGYDEAGREMQTDRLLSSPDASITLQDGPLTPGDGLVTVRTAFDAADRPIQRVDDSLVSSWTEYDSRGRVSRVRDALGNETRSFYDANGNRIREELAELAADGTPLPVRKRWFFYDRTDRRVAEADDTGRATRTLYDSGGRVAYRSDARSSIQGLALSSLDPFGERTDLDAILINGFGNPVTTLFDPAGRPVQRDEYLLFGGLGGNALDPSQAGDGKITTRFLYDARGRLQASVDDIGNATTYDYDTLDRRIRETRPDGSSKTWVYDAEGHPTRTTDENGTVVLDVYDALGRLKSRGVTPGSPDVLGTTFEVYVYDALGHVVSAQDDDSLVTAVYDSLGRRIRETQNGWTVDSRADGSGRRTSVTYPSGLEVDSSYDAAGRLDRLTEAGAAQPLAQYGYEGFGRLTSVDRPGPGLRADFHYDATFQVDQVTHSVPASGTVLAEFTSTWDAAGNRTARTDVLRGTLQRFGYDSANRLISSTRTRGSATISDVSYDLDGAMNRTAVAGGLYPGTPTRTGSDALLNQYTTVPDGSTAGEVRTHDARGQLTAVAGSRSRELRYDFAGRLVEARDLALGVTTTWRTDVFGRRFAEERDGGSGPVLVATFLYDDWDRIEERDASGSLLATYLRGPGTDEILSERVSGTESFPLQDDHRNVLARADATGTLLEAYAFDDYGTLLDPDSNYAPLASPTTLSPFFFQGRPLDSSTGFIDFRNRHLDPIAGRFTAPDPLGTWGDAASRGNAFSFEGGNPWSLTDPAGLAVDPGITSLPRNAATTYPQGWPFPALTEFAANLWGGHMPADPTIQVEQEEPPGFRTQPVALEKGPVGWSWQFEDPDNPEDPEPSDKLDDPQADDTHEGDPDDEDPEEEGGGWLSWVHVALDAAGLVPGVGNIADLVNGGIYLVEGDYGNAALSGLAAVPIIGQEVGAGRLAAKYGDEALDAARYVDDAIDIGDAARGVGSLDDLSRAAGELDRNGLTKAGRALQKHSSRPGSAFSTAASRAGDLNAAGQSIVDDILTAPGSLQRENRLGGIDVLAPGGRGVRFNPNGSFRGFLEPQR
ncbi:MAG TPA: hypothetical protein ENJ09_13935 [Planctomycetes bacterium]|nr:hypothetical protein [Planctomycetota bacterium]